MTYDQIHPVSGLWPEWSRPVMLTYDSGEDKELTKLFWNNPRRFIGCARCGIIHPLTGEWIDQLQQRGQFSYCRQCAAEAWSHVPQESWELDRKAVHPFERSRFVLSGDQLWCVEYIRRWRRHELRARLKDALSRSRSRPWPNDLDFRRLQELWCEQCGLCALSVNRCAYGIRASGSDGEGPSVDRLDHRYGYYKINVQLTRWADNHSRRRRDLRRSLIEGWLGHQFSDVEWLGIKPGLP
jgi:hypothetical protein